MTQQFLISRSYNNPYLMKRRESIHICRVDVCPPGQKFLHLLAIPRSTGGQKNTTITEPYPTFSFGFRRFPERLAVLPPLELLGPLHESRVGPGLQRHGAGSDSLPPLSPGQSHHQVARSSWTYRQTKVEMEGAVSKIASPPAPLCTARLGTWRHGEPT